ncbi:MAG: PAS domain-containing protein [Candidatus Riflebacteria bacterium]|nr:PAS domain-containing protein [Candidatus Riflebacteria bacterium]
MVILEEMAMDLAYGIEAQRTRLAHLQAEEALCQSEKNLRSAQALAHIGNWTLNPATGKIWWSEEIHRILGHDPALPPPILQELQEMFMPASWDRLLAAIDQAVGSGTPYDLELEYRRQDGTTGWARALGQAVHDANGKVVELHGTFQDVTAQKRMEAELLAHQENLEHLVAERTGLLKESEERYRVVIENTGQIVYELDVLTGQTIHAGAIEEVLEYSPAEFQLPFEQWLAGIHPDDRERVLPQIVGATKAPGSYKIEYRYLRKDDGYRYILDRGMSFADGEDKVFRVIGTMADITERKQFEETLKLKNIELEKAKAAADRANLAKSAFLSNMSHEIRTPMNAILGFAQVLARDPALKATQAGHVQTIIRSGNHLLTLIDDILDISKIEAGQATLNLSTLSLRNLLADLKMMFNSRAAGKGLQLLMECDDNLPGHVLADENKLRQILINLMGNAIKFTVTGGVSVRLRSDSVDDQPWTGTGPFRLIGEVEDTGPGIADEDIPKIFGTFQQAGAGLKVGGTGLGLAISRGFARLMAGDITFTSQPGKGSCFRFNVLLEAVESVAESVNPISKQVIGLRPGTGPCRVLVADDIPENRELIVRLLGPVGFEVQDAANGAEALDIFKTWLPHVVLMDMRMPVMDGYEAIQRLRTTDAGRAIPIIAVTASAFEDNKEQVMKVGADAFLRKPFRPEELFAEISKLLDLHYVFADKPAQSHTHSQPAPIVPETVSALPHDLLVSMRQAVADGDMVGLTELIIRVAKIDSVTASGLQDLANRFDYETLAALLSNEGKKG